jgi:hypothetical protein
MSTAKDITSISHTKKKARLSVIKQTLEGTLSLKIDTDIKELALLIAARWHICFDLLAQCLKGSNVQE